MHPGTPARHLHGKTGTGRVYLAISLGIEASHQGIRSRFVTGSERISELGCVSFSKEGFPLLFQVLANRYERDSIITNVGFDDGTQQFGDPILTAGLLDHITHKACIINCNWESYRLKGSLTPKSVHRSRGGPCLPMSG